MTRSKEAVESPKGCVKLVTSYNEPQPGNTSNYAFKLRTKDAESYTLELKMVCNLESLKRKRCLSMDTIPRINKK